MDFRFRRKGLIETPPQGSAISMSMVVINEDIINRENGSGEQL